MKRNERLELIRKVLEVYLGEPIDKTYVTVESADNPDDYVQFIFHDGGILYGEVGSHEWTDSPEPLSEDARKALIKLGHDDTMKKAIDSLYQIASMEPASDADYDPVRKVVQAVSPNVAGEVIAPPPSPSPSA